jgi:hypothetical protein
VTSTLIFSITGITWRWLFVWAEHVVIERSTKINTSCQLLRTKVLFKVWTVQGVYFLITLIPVLWLLTGCSAFKWCIMWLDMQLIWWSYLPNWIGESNRPGVIPPTPQRLSAAPNIPDEQSPSDMAPKGGNPWDGRRAPGVLNTFVVFFLFFHLALRFWNQTCELSSHRSHVKALIYIRTPTSNVTSFHSMYTFAVRCYGGGKTVAPSLHKLS